MQESPFIIHLIRSSYDHAVGAGVERIHNGYLMITWHLPIGRCGCCGTVYHGYHPKGDFFMYCYCSFDDGTFGIHASAHLV